MAYRLGCELAFTSTRHGNGMSTWADTELAVGSPGTQTHIFAESPDSRGQDMDRGRCCSVIPVTLCGSSAWKWFCSE